MDLPNYGVTPVYIANWIALHKKKEDGTRKYKYIINKGSSRSSKTYSLIDIYDSYAKQNPYKRLTIWRDTKKSCKDTVLKDALKHHKLTDRYNKLYQFHKTESIFFYNNNSTVEICGTDDEEAVHGFTQDVAWLNEPYKISKDTFDQIDQRTSDVIFIDYNPKKDHWVDKLTKLPNAIVIHSTYSINAYCPPEQKIKIESYQPLEMCSLIIEKRLTTQEAIKYDLEKNVLNFSEKQKKELKRCIKNEENETANKYKWQVYGLGEKAELPNRIFYFKEIKYSDYLKIDVPVWYGVDWGSVDPMGIIEVKYYDGKLFVHELSYKSENDIKKDLSLTQKAQINKEIKEGFIMWYFKMLGLDNKRPLICDNNRELKIIALRKAGFDLAIATRKWKGSIIDGIDLLNNLDVYYTHTSDNLKYEQENYTRLEDKRTGEVLEEPIDANNHTLDPLRYVAQKMQELEIIKII